MDSFTENASSVENITTQERGAFVVVYAVMIAFSSIVAFFGNILVISAVVLHTALRKTQNTFIVNLAVTDLLNAGIMASSAASAIDNGLFYHQHPAFCEFVASVSIVISVCSITSIAAIAVDRYIFICLYKTTHTKVLNRFTLLIIVGCIWLYAFLVDLPNFLGWGAHGFVTEIYSCSLVYDKIAETGYNYFILSLGFLLPLVLTFYSYVNIYIFVRKSQFPQNMSATKIKAVDKQVLKTVGIILAVFLLMWLPYSIIGSLVDVFTVPYWLFLLCGWMSFSNSSVNFMIYAFNQNFREGYKIVQMKVFRTEPSSSQTDITLDAVQKSSK